jgi:hypothetical protein
LDHGNCESGNDPSCFLRSAQRREQTPNLVPRASDNWIMRHDKGQWTIGWVRRSAVAELHSQRIAASRSLRHRTQSGDALAAGFLGTACSQKSAGIRTSLQKMVRDRPKGVLLTFSQVVRRYDTLFVGSARARSPRSSAEQNFSAKTHNERFSPLSAHRAGCERADEFGCRKQAVGSRIAIATLLFWPRR